MGTEEKRSFSISAVTVTWSGVSANGSRRTRESRRVGSVFRFLERVAARARLRRSTVISKKKSSS